MTDFTHLGLPDGGVRPYRPCPADFREVYLALGQSKDIEEHYGTNWRVIRRWIEESGGEALRAARRELTGNVARPWLRSGKRRQGRAKRYVLGRTLRGKQPEGEKE